MKTYIFYAAATKLGVDHQPVFVAGRALKQVYVRVEVIEGDLDDGLDRAKPLPGETVLNSWSPDLTHSTDVQGGHDA